MQYGGANQNFLPPAVCSTENLVDNVACCFQAFYVYFPVFGILGMRTSSHVRAKIKQDFAVTKYLIVPKSLFM